jgi:hypothetical protein
MMPHTLHIHLSFYILDGVKFGYFSAINQPLYIIQNPKKAPPTVVQTSFEYCFCL